MMDYGEGKVFTEENDGNSKSLFPEIFETDNFTLDGFLGKLSWNEQSVWHFHNINDLRQASQLRQVDFSEVKNALRLVLQTLK